MVDLELHHRMTESTQHRKWSLWSRRILETTRGRDSKLSFPIKTLQRPGLLDCLENPTMLIKISMKAEGTDSKNISMTPIFEK